MRSTYLDDALVGGLIVYHAQYGDAHVAADAERDHEADAAEQRDRVATAESATRRVAVRARPVHPVLLRSVEMSSSRER